MLAFRTFEVLFSKIFLLYAISFCPASRYLFLRAIVYHPAFSHLLLFGLMFIIYFLAIGYYLFAGYRFTHHFHSNGLLFQLIVPMLFRYLVLFAVMFISRIRSFTQVSPHLWEFFTNLSALVGFLHNCLPFSSQRYFGLFTVSIFKALPEFPQLRHF